MKKIFSFLIIMILCAGALKVSAQNTAVNTSSQIRYYFYPAQNVYYNDVNGDYWYFDAPSTRWITVKKLPSTYVVNETSPKFVIFYSGNDVWKQNRLHLKKFKVDDNKKIKIKAEAEQE